MLSIGTRVFATVFCLSVVAPAHATLFSRLGGAAAYDDVLDITWVTDAGLSGTGTWDDQVAWASGLDYLGFDDWRLASQSVAAGLPTGGPVTTVVDCNLAMEPDCRDNELGYMFNHNLGASLGDDLVGDRTVGDVTLTDIHSLYWSGTEYDSHDAWHFYFSNGIDHYTFKDSIGPGRFHYGWAVRSGDVAVPEPGTAVLMGAGLAAGLLGFGRSKRRH